MPVAPGSVSCPDAEGLLVRAFVALARLGAFVFNLPGTASNQRHSLDAGNMRFSPSRVRFFREERAAGLTAGYTL